MTKHEAISDREDVSRFIVHLTRNDRQDFPKSGGSPRRNLLGILEQQTIFALRPHCFFNEQLKKLNNRVRKKIMRKFSTVCLTEVPLNQIHLLSRKIPGRQIELRPYGLVFNRDFIIAAGGQPAFYINGYNHNRFLHECFNALYRRSLDGDTLRSPVWRVLPFINAMHERYDFTWEREWRVLGDLDFRIRDVVAIILPSEGDDDLKEDFAKEGIAVISPGWTYEQIVTELARQQRKMRSLTKLLRGKTTVARRSA